jgi:NAD(P)-dependent dehydrogenase (short-subunit alcohol dehydrogenase family)
MHVFEVHDQHILVTGGSSGFGRHFAHFLASNGARVTLAARRADALASVVADINKSGCRAQGVVLDVTLADRIEGAMKEAEATFGPIHAVVNNAGVTATKPALDQDERDWDSVVDTNLKGVWLVAQAAARRMIANKVNGSIVNIASILGLRVAALVQLLLMRAVMSCHASRQDTVTLCNLRTRGCAGIEKSDKPNANQTFCVHHNAIDQFLDGRNVVNQPHCHATAPGARIHITIDHEIR